ncbi:hypothetical protein [Streptomyces sp. C10-9-1]|uniref:hypothetical protein n=1 Tax=Streptomyces sp. C10-9-1 TaxID=1859285 RepID=UPI0027E412A2|nr:hypothetical protein [Streptomyces sp. C10-9-1]
MVQPSAEGRRRGARAARIGREPLDEDAVEDVVRRAGAGDRESPNPRPPAPSR